MESLYGSNWHEIELLLYLPLQKGTKNGKFVKLITKKHWENQGEKQEITQN